MIRYYLPLVALLLCACTQTSLRYKDELVLQDMRRHITPEKFERPIMRTLFFEDPIDAAEKAAAKNDYRLIGMAMGYGAGEKDVRLSGIACKEPVETEKLIYGCVPPPLVILKQAGRYNAAMIAQPGFPADRLCAVDEAYLENLKRWDEKEERDLRKSRQYHYN